MSRTDEVARLQAQFGWDSMTALRHLQQREQCRQIAERKRSAAAATAVRNWAKGWAK